MQVKRFFAADMRTAMKLVRDELGADASIIGNRRVAGGVELTAALDYQAPAPARPNPALEAELRKTQARIASAQAELTTRAEQDAGKDRQLFANESLLAPELPATPVKPQRPLEAPVAAAPAVDPRALDAMRFELHGLRELIEVQLGSIAWGQLQNRRPQQANLWRRLQRMGLSAELSQALLSKVAGVAEPRQAWRMLLAHLAHAIRTPKVEPLEEGGVIALVGPAGMGKTTTLAKLAARYVARYGTEGLALVTTDDFRIGAQEQLATYGRLLGVPVLTASGVEGLQQVLARLASKRMVLIDTAGMSPSDQQLATRLQQFGVDGGRVRTLLVLAATTQPEDQARAIHAFRPARPVGCVVTKLDESSRHGAVLSSVTRARLPVVYVADGQAVPEDLHRERPENLIKRAVQAARAHSTKTHDAQTSPGDYDREAANAVA